MAKLEPFSGDYYLWDYVPSIAASIIFFLIYLALTLFHVWKAWITRARFCIPFIIGGFCTSFLFLPVPAISFTMTPNHMQSTQLK